MMKISAAEIIDKIAQPLPGANPPPVSQQPIKPGRVPGEPAPESVDTTLSPELAEDEENQPVPEAQTIIKNLQSKHFNDKVIEEVSSGLMSLIPLVPPKHAEKLADVYGKYAEAMAKLKANLASILVMMAPQQAQMKQMEQIFSPGDGGSESAQNPYRIGPLT